MEMNYFVLLSWLILVNTPLSHGVETISGNEYLTQNTTISSPNKRFELGFFKPGQSSNYYVGIWYKNISPQSVVWVANRVTPIPSSAINSTRLTILNGNLVLLNGAHNFVWSTNITAKQSYVLAALKDNGNLVLLNCVNSETPIWESFEHPTDTFLPGSKLGINKRTKTKQTLTSWKSPDDPAPGQYSVDTDGNTAVTMWNGTEEYRNTGPKFGLGVDPALKPSPAYNFSVVENENESYFTYNVKTSVVSRYILDINGQQKSQAWLEATHVWASVNVLPPLQCDVYAYCGPFSICTDNSSPVCACLYGFSSETKEWSCVRKRSLKCEDNNDMDMFKMYPNVRLPRHPQNRTSSNQGECESVCLKNCSCTAYAYSNSSGYCSFWFGELLNVKQFGEDHSNGGTIYIRLAASEFSIVKGTNSKHLSRMLKAIIPTVAVALLIAGIIFSVCYTRRRTTLKRTEPAVEPIDEIIDNEDSDDEKGIGVQFFTFETILEATNNFSSANKLGKGGFGPVYKGIFPGRQEIAVKRLSSQSGQGINEFKNEVVLIAKLQHRNLVKLIGYCTQAGEKMLIYEYMPNKSLDTFIFDQTRGVLLDWSKRFDIILGIARGLLYLHRDSRLRIIHRDMKTSNILLDEEMTPKISDFGLARMVARNTLEANTKKVVGTFGYISPEYALGGLFSFKSDIFSFGVIILEIISGKKNTAFYEHAEVSNLLGYAWKLWNEGNVMDLVDESLLNSCKEQQVLKCINVGLLCVEEDPNCRPSMPDVLLMLSDKSTVLPKPKQPAFVTRTQTHNDSFNVQSQKPCSNQLTFSTQEGL